MAEYLDQVIESGIDINPIMLYNLTPYEISKMVIGSIKKADQENKNNNMRAGVIAAAIYNVNRDRKKRPKPYTWNDIFGEEYTEKKPQTPLEIKNICKNICIAMGGKINGT